MVQVTRRIIVRDIHLEAVVKAVAAVLHRHADARHTAHLLGDGDGIGVDLVDQLIGESEVHNRIAILPAIVVVGVGAEGLTETMIEVKHRGDAIEAEAVEVEALKPVLTIGEEEVEHLVFSVVKAH